MTEDLISRVAVYGDAVLPLQRRWLAISQTEGGSISEGCYTQRRLKFA